MEITNEIARITLRRDHRAWMQMTFDITKLKAGSPEIGTLHIVNSGRSPSTRINGMVAVETLKTSEAPKIDYAGVRTKFETGIMFPSSTPTMDVVLRRGGRDGPIPITEDEIKGFENGDIYFVFEATVDYKDAFGDHWTHYCNYNIGLPLKPVPIVGCLNYNAVDDSDN